MEEDKQERNLLSTNASEKNKILANMGDDKYSQNTEKRIRLPYSSRSNNSLRPSSRTLMENSSKKLEKGTEDQNQLIIVDNINNKTESNIDSEIKSNVLTDTMNSTILKATPSLNLTNVSSSKSASSSIVPKRTNYLSASSESVRSSKKDSSGKSAFSSVPSLSMPNSPANEPFNTSSTVIDITSALPDNKTIIKPSFSSLNLNKRIATVPSSLSLQKALTMPSTIPEEEEKKERCRGAEDDNNSESQVLVTPDERSTPQLLMIPPSGSMLTLSKVSKDSIRSDRPLSLCGSLADFLNRIRLGNRRIRRRAVFKNGDCNIIRSKPARDRIRFLQDFFTTLVDTQWRWTLICFALSFFVSWLIFALIWWLIAFTHGDLEPDHLPDRQGETGWTPCIVGIWGFTSCYLFSIETQHTIGYGSRSTTEECPEAVFIMSMQSILGVIIQALFVGIVFAKMSRPKHRTQTLLFSKNAVVCQRDNHLCLMFRVGDMAKSHIIGASIKARLIRSKTTAEGEMLNYFQEELAISADGCAGDLFFIWPMTIVHVIDENSPLYHLTASDMLQERFEIVVILEGTIESTGQSTQARSSYLNSEILWGHKFEQVVNYNKEKQGYEVDLSKFNNTIPVGTPLCSGKELVDFYKTQEQDGATKDVPFIETSVPLTSTEK